MDEKNAYMQKLEARLNQWGAEVDKLQAKSAEASADAKLEYQNQIEKLRGMQDDARQELDKLESAQGEAWKDLKSGIEKAWDNMGNAVKQATDRFR